MDISPEMLAIVVVLTILGLLFTGPGMWSERWGWKWLQGRGEGRKSESGGASPSDKPK